MALNFFIKKNSTLPILKYPITDKILTKYDITSDMLSNCAVTFSLLSADTGFYHIANVTAEIIYLPDRAKYPNDTEYSLGFSFRKGHLPKSGLYKAEFTIDFLGDYCGSIKLPENDQINVIVIDSITKTDVI